MNRILEFREFMLFIAGLFVSSSAVVLMAPHALWVFLGISIPADSMAFLARAQIPWLVSMGILAFLLRDREVSDTDARAYLLALLGGCVLAFFLALYGVVANILSGFGWFAVALFLGLGAVSAYFLREGS